MSSYKMVYSIPTNNVFLGTVTEIDGVEYDCSDLIMEDLESLKEYLENIGGETSEIDEDFQSIDVTFEHEYNSERDAYPIHIFFLQEVDPEFKIYYFEDCYVALPEQVARELDLTGGV